MRGSIRTAAVWSALLLIIFHAVAKSLLFLCVGIIEYKLGSRDIEDMDFLIMRLPKLTAIMMIGMAGMFLAPFGMIISKFVTLKAFIESNPAMAIILAYGSAATIFFWTKWMGKIISIKHGVAEVMEHRVSTWEWITLGILAVATVAVCLAFRSSPSTSLTRISWNCSGHFPVVDTFNVLIVFVIMLGLLIILPLGLLYYAFVNKDYKRVGTYLGGGNINNITFEGAMASTQPIELKNYYLEKYFGEERLDQCRGFCLVDTDLHHVRGGSHMNGIYECIQSWSILERMLAFVLLAPLAGGALAGIDRK